MSARQPIGFTTPLVTTPAGALAFTRELAWVVIALLAVRMLMDAHMLWRYYQTTAVISALVSGSEQSGVLDEAAMTQAEQLLHGNMITQQRYMLLMIPLPVLFLYFVYRSRQCLEWLNARELEFTAAWSVGWFLIPFLNLVRPYAVMSELWRASDPDHRDPVEWRRAPVSRVVLAWWMTFITAFAVQPAVMLLLRLAGSMPIEAGLQMFAMALSMQALALPAGALGIVVVHSLAARQQEKYARLEILRAVPANLT